jgi:DNA-binding MarR family transcriptional regulator
VSNLDLDLADELRAAVGEFVRRGRRDDRMPQGQAAVLGYLDRGGAMSIAELARLEQVKHQSMTRTVNLLSDQGLVALAKDELDRRQIVVAITPAGERALGEERYRRASRIARAIRDDLTDGEQEIVRQLPEILRKLRPDAS